MVVLQAIVDDSASDTGDRRLFLAGYLARADVWAAFSDLWSQALAAPPAIKYLKMREAQNLSGEFRGWTQEARDLKIARLIRVINNFEPMSFEFSVSREQFDRLVKPASPHGLGSAHFSCTFGIVSAVSRFVAEAPETAPIDFIFDEQSGVSEDITLLFSYMKESLPKSARQLITGTPIFRDDKAFLPIQAADMLVWHLRREHERFGERGKLDGANLLRSREHLCSELPEQILLRWADHYKKMPGAEDLRGKKVWRNFKAEYSNLAARGFVPPYGSRWKNALYRFRERIVSFIRL